MIGEKATKFRGGEWVLRSPAAEDVYTPEDLDDSHREVARTVADFVRRAPGRCGRAYWWVLHGFAAGAFVARR